MNHTAIDRLLERLIFQLDTLIPFLGISHREVFELMEKEKHLWFPQDQQGAVPDTYQIYQSLIVRSAFLLGYSYFEAFLTDLVREIYQSNPKMLPKDKQVRFGEITELATYKNIVELMIDKEVLDLFYQGMDKIIEYFQKKLQLEWEQQQKSTAIQASLMRNCFVHNMGRADSRLAQFLGCKPGEEICLTVSDVHSFGMVARNLARSLIKQARERYFSSVLRE